jgi:hypothetical protein
MAGGLQRDHPRHTTPFRHVKRSKLLPGDSRKHWVWLVKMSRSDKRSVFHHFRYMLGGAKRTYEIIVHNTLQFAKVGVTYSPSMSQRELARLCESRIEGHRRHLRQTLARYLAYAHGVRTSRRFARNIQASRTSRGWVRRWVKWPECRRKKPFLRSQKLAR